MNRARVFGALLVAVGILSSAAMADEHRHGVPAAPAKILTFEHMYGVDGPFVGPVNPVRDIPGDELPWAVASAKGRLDVRGHLMIQVRGLVFADDPEVPPDLRGKNDETQFRGAVSCLTETAAGGVATANVVTDGSPASVRGDSTIDAFIELPNPCLAPVAFVLAGSEDKWFAVNGIETGGD